VIEMRKKFAADKLQRSYGAFAELYGFTKDQVKDALKRLEDKGLIELVFRHPVVNGQKLGNVLYIGLNVDRLKEITTPLLPLKQRGSKDESAEPLTFKDDTNTEITKTETRYLSNTSPSAMLTWKSQDRSRQSASLWIGFPPLVIG
jgi:DNA-binding Lrp family transcriptional regulator